MINLSEIIRSGKEDESEHLSAKRTVKNHLEEFSLPLPARISLKRALSDNIYILVIGDSIMWGQGLKENEKFYSIVEKAVRAKNKKVDVAKSVKAHSGAIIGVGHKIDDLSDIDIQTGNQGPIPGEVPTDFPTILQQCGFWFNGLKKVVDLILVNGGVNDIGVKTIIDPRTDYYDLEKMIHQHCYVGMKVLLKKLAKEYPNASIIVTGYYAFASDDTDTTKLMTAIPALMPPVAILDPVGLIVSWHTIHEAKQFMVSNCRKFWLESTSKIEDAISEVNASLETSRIFFADSSFRPENAIFASDPWVFGVPDAPPPPPVFGNEEELKQWLDFVGAEDNVEVSRRADCIKFSSRTSENCRIASVGHPNPKGAKSYAGAIIPSL